jgi:hypothetical protein
MSSLNNNNNNDLLPFNSNKFSTQDSQKNVFQNSTKTKGQEVVSITYEEIGLFPRSFSRVLDRFLKQIFSDVENLVIQEYRFYRYLFLTTLKCLLILFFVPFLVNILAKTYIVRPLTEYFWNTKQTEIFLNSYQQKRAFSELKEFEEKTYFESLIFPKSVFKPNLHNSSWIGGSFSSLDDKEVSGETTKISSLERETNLIEVDNEKKQTLLNDKDLLLVEANSVSELANLPSDCYLRFDRARTGASAVQPAFCPKGAFTAPEQGGVSTLSVSEGKREQSTELIFPTTELNKRIEGASFGTKDKMDEYKQTESLINSYTMKSSLFVYQTQEADKTIQQRYQEKTIELAQRYNDQSIEAITNFFADLISLFTLFYLLYVLEIQINITKSFLLEVFFGLDDSKKSLLILLITDLLVGYHSSNLWELFFEFLFHHYGLPESQTGIFLLVATLPVLLDVLFKYLIFRHLNRSSPATVATYHAMIE